MIDTDRRVARGAAVLDERRPGWREEIKLDQLDMGVCTRCILGQLFGTYLEGLIALRREEPGTTTVAMIGEGWAAAHGFTVRDYGREYEFGWLDEAWAREVYR